MAKKPTISDVASAANVSTATVSRVFNEKLYVSKDIRSAVLAVAQQIGYTPRKYKKKNAIASTELTIGVVIADLQNTFFQKVIKGLLEVFNDSSISALICNSDENPQIEIQSLSTLIEHKVDGIIISPASDAAGYNQEFLQEIYHKIHLPIVLVDRDLKGIGLDGVFQDSYTAAFNATKEFVKNGHKDIAIIAGPTTSKPGLDRLHGYMEAMKESKLQIHEEYIMYGDFKIESGYALTKKIIDCYPMVTAIFCSNNLMALGALRALNKANKQVPNDMAIITTGSLDEYSIFYNSGITELDLPAEEMGYECAHLMMERLANSGKRRNFVARRITLNIPLHLRGSERYPENRLSPRNENP